MPGAGIFTSGELSWLPAQLVRGLAIVARWFYSGWCDGELLLFDDWERVPFRKVVNAIARAAKGSIEAHA